MRNIVIHNNNINLMLFDSRIKFNPTDSVDQYISSEIIPQLIEKDFDIIFIKDNLSSNYLELLGLRVAYHIRLSEELQDKRYCPIIILSDFDSYVLNKVDPMAKILFTKNIYIISNTKKEIELYKTRNYKKLTLDEYDNDFLKHVSVEPPQDYTDHHDITNEWAISQWSTVLDAHSNAIEKNHQKISSMLYFKYLKSLHSKETDEQNFAIKKSQAKGKILYIDDEWNKGWSDILESLFSHSTNMEFSTFKKENFVDANSFNILSEVTSEIKNIDPDVVILDLRLSRTDHNPTTALNKFTGIKVVQAIKEINPGIQIIMMTATRQGIILEKLFDYGILGYIKKEHPDDLAIRTDENIDKLFGLVEKGLRRKYLKEVWDISLRLTNKLEEDPFHAHFDDNSHLDYSESLAILKNEAKFIFDILDGEMGNKLNYALISLASSLDAIQNIFIDCIYNRDSKKTDCYYIDSIMPSHETSLYKQILYIINKMNHKETFKNKEKTLNKLIKARNNYIHSNDGYRQVQPADLLTWFSLLDTIVNLIKNPKQRKQYTPPPVNPMADAFANLRK